MRRLPEKRMPIIKSAWRIQHDQRSYPFQFMRTANPLSRDHGEPCIFPFFGMDLEHVRSDKTRRDAVDAAEIDPFNCQTSGELHESSFRGV